MKKNNALNIRRLVNESFVPSTQRASVLYGRLSDFCSLNFLLKWPRMDKCLLHILFWNFMLSSCWVALCNDWLVVAMHVLYTLLDFRPSFSYCKEISFCNFTLVYYSQRFADQLLFHCVKVIFIDFSLLIEISQGHDLFFSQNWKVTDY